MIAFGLKRIYFVADKVIVRTLRHVKHNPNPGLEHRMRAFKEEKLNIEEEDAEEFMEQSQSDFFKVGEAYDEHINETILGKVNVRHQIIKEKYFKENMPNLLTWSEKEQIRHLAMEHPKEWTPERIAESFPVTVSVVKKLIKFPWKPATMERINRHDASAMRNWKDLKEGNFNIPEDLRKHMLKFSDRTIPPLNQKAIKIDLTQEKKMGEYESIIRKFAAKENQNKEGQQNCNTEKQQNCDQENQNNKQNNKKSDKMTLDELTSKIKERLNKKEEIEMSDQIILSTVSNAKAAPTKGEVELYEDNDLKKSVKEFKENNEEEPEKILNYPERIRIPKKAFKHGATYKVNDCYYDYDGRFLYRVLGMNQ